MPSVIAIEAKPVEFEGIDTGYLHLYLVKTVTDAQGRVVSEKVIRGTAGSNGDLETLAGSDLASSPDRRGSDTPRERHRTELDLGTRDADDVWRVMVQHASNIEKADLDYSIDIFREFPGGDLNSNSVVASVLHSVGIDWTRSLPSDVSRSDTPLYGQLQYMNVNDVLSGTADSDRILGGIGNDTIYGNGENDKLSGEAGNDRLWGSAGNDTLSGGANDDRLYGGYGSDALLGGSGKDAFVFHAKLSNRTDLDTIRDFSVTSDTVWLENSVFTGLGAGRLKSGAFWTGDNAHDANDRVIYDRDSGVLYYDSDGNGAAEQVAVTKISKSLKMTSADFQVI